jgi:hypothetical protein
MHADHKEKRSMHACIKRPPQIDLPSNLRIAIPPPCIRSYLIIINSLIASPLLLRGERARSKEVISG